MIHPHSQVHFQCIPCAPGPRPRGPRRPWVPGLACPGPRTPDPGPRAQTPGPAGPEPAPRPLGWGPEGSRPAPGEHEPPGPGPRAWGPGLGPPRAGAWGVVNNALEMHSGVGR